QGLRAGLGCVSVLSARGNDAGARPAVPRSGNGGTGPRAERDRDPGRRTDLSRQGRADAPGGLRIDDARARAMEGRAAPVGSSSPIPVRAVGPAVRRSRVKAVMVGATRGMGRALARLMAERGARIFLLGRDSADLTASARDLEARGTLAPVKTAVLD